MADLGSLAGILSRRDPPGEEALNDLRRVLGAEGTAGVQAWGSLAVGWTGAPPARDGQRRCLLAGPLFGRGADEPARAVLAGWEGGRADPPAWLRGDFTLVLWDGERATGLLARDQMGQRGLFFCDDGTLV